MQVLLSFMRKRILIGFILLCACFSVQNVSAQRVALKTNALEYLVLTPNLSLEARLSRKLSLQVGLSVNPIHSAIGDYKFTNCRLEPELRYWFNRPMARHFMALSTTVGGYSLQLKDRLMDFNAFGAGLSYGYALVLNRHWNVEFELGAGVAYVNGSDYKKSELEENHNNKENNMKKFVPIPIRAAVSFSYIFK